MEKICIDATVFLGLNSKKEAERIATKNFFVGHFQSELYMSYEQVAVCDNTIWTRSHAEQSLYFPFMDFLMTELRLIRKPYSEQTLRLMEKNSNLSFTERLTCAFAEEHDCKLYTLNKNIIKSQTVPLGNMKDYYQLSELMLPADFEGLYQQALGVRI